MQQVNDDKNTCHAIYEPYPGNSCIYRKHEFKIDLLLFKRCSKYFYKNYHKLAKGEMIHLIDDQNYPDFSNFIETFINFCHGNYINLTDDNVIPLHYFSKIYEVESLEKNTKEYINQHHHHLFSKIILYDPQNKIFNITEIEESISKNLYYYIKNEEDNLISLPINSLYHIISMYNNQENKQEEEKDEIVNFLFKCLDKKGRSASILFNIFDFGKDQTKHINYLVDNYSEQFDFNFINIKTCQIISEQHKTIENLQKELDEKNLLLECFIPTIKFLDQEDMIQRCKQIRKDIDDGKITSVELPSGLKEVPPFCFYECEKLRRIKIPSSVITIDSHAFTGCTSLEEVVFEENSSLLHIRHYAFSWCGSLNKIEIPDSVVSFGYHCFNQCFKLNNIKIPFNTIYIGDFAFNDCNLFLTSLDLPLSLAYVGNFAFNNCLKLKALNIQSPNTFFGCYSFFNCKSLESLKFADSTRHIHLNNFNGCTEIKTVVLPDSIEIIDGGAFWNCIKLNNINIPKSIRLINAYTFDNCPQLPNDFKSQIPPSTFVAVHAFGK